MDIRAFMITFTLTFISLVHVKDTTALSCTECDPKSCPVRYCKLHWMDCYIKIVKGRFQSFCNNCFIIRIWTPFAALVVLLHWTFVAVVGPVQRKEMIAVEEFGWLTENADPKMYACKCSQNRVYHQYAYVNILYFYYLNVLTYRNNFCLNILRGQNRAANNRDDGKWWEWNLLW